VPDSSIEESLLAILEAVEALAHVNRELVDTCKQLMDRDSELGDGLVDLERRLSFVTGRARLLFSMKAATLTTSCRRCGTTFAKEPGPELCGPCWTELGRPERYLETITTAPTTEGNETA